MVAEEHFKIQDFKSLLAFLKEMQKEADALDSVHSKFLHLY